MAKLRQNRILGTNQVLKFTAWGLSATIVLLAGLFVLQQKNNQKTALQKVRVYVTKTPSGQVPGTASAATTSSINQLSADKIRLSQEKNLSPADRLLLHSVEKRLRLWREVADHEDRLQFRKNQPGFQTQDLQLRVDSLKAEIKQEKDRIPSTE
ncbi:MAG: hypothetical protein SF052_16860 [Bacteroidia bacterium]|nr:hypothetical protein [Bacteroidia bacterium]